MIGLFRAILRICCSSVLAWKVGPNSRGNLRFFNDRNNHSKPYPFKHIHTYHIPITVLYLPWAVSLSCWFSCCGVIIEFNSWFTAESSTITSRSTPPSGSPPSLTPKPPSPSSVLPFSLRSPTPSHLSLERSATCEARLEADRRGLQV